MQALIAMDPAAAKHCAWAYGVDEILEVGFSAAHARHLIQREPGCEVVVEGQFPGRNPGATLKLAFAAGNEAGLWGVHRDDLRQVKPSEWKRGYPKPKRPNLETYELYHAVRAALTADETVVVLAALAQCTRVLAKLDVVDAAGLWLWVRGRLPKASEVESW